MAKTPAETLEEMFARVMAEEAPETRPVYCVHPEDWREAQRNGTMPRVLAYGMRNATPEERAESAAAAGLANAIKPDGEK